jgi:NitT/TauT family transport system permease protein
MRISIFQNKKNTFFGIFIWLIIWEIAYLAISQDIYLPSPFSVLKSMIDIIQEKEFYRIIVMTSYRVCLSFFLSVLLGLATGLICGLNQKIFEIFEPLVILIRSTPVISIIILAIIWFKSSYSPVFTGFLMCFPVIWTNMVQGIRNTDTRLLEMCQIYEISFLSKLRHVYLPSALPFIFSGFSTALGLTWKVVAAAEVLSLPKYGIGSKLHDSKAYLEIPQLFAWTTIIILLSFIFEFILTRFFAKNNAYQYKED